MNNKTNQSIPISDVQSEALGKAVFGRALVDFLDTLPPDKVEQLEAELKQQNSHDMAIAHIARLYPRFREMLEEEEELTAFEMAKQIESKTAH